MCFFQKTLKFVLEHVSDDLLNVQIVYLAQLINICAFEAYQIGRINDMGASGERG